MTKKKQVIFLMTDTTRKDMLGCYNPNMHTPNLDRLAAEGIRYENAYTCQPVCGPARSAIFTGTFPHTNGMVTNSIALGDNVKTIGQRLSDHGIDCGYIGKWHLDGSDYFGNGRCPDGWKDDYWYDMRRYLEELSEEDRIKSMQNALEAGLELYTCCEPIGPEHSVDELVDNIFIGIEMNIYQHAAMRRVAVPGAPLAHYGQISELRLAQIVAVIALASATVPTMAYMGAHEPNKLCYTAGANIITAESGANPRDNSDDTAENRGMDMARCRKMMFECGFDYLRRGDESKIPLDFDYLLKTDSWQ